MNSVARDSRWPDDSTKAKLNLMRMKLSYQGNSIQSWVLIPVAARSIRLYLKTAQANTTCRDLRI